MKQVTNTSRVRLRDMMPANYGEILRKRLGYKVRQMIYTVVNSEDKDHPIYKEALKLAAETKAKKEKEEAEQKELEQRLLCA
ncbi:hypothetical protein [Rufibacter soli]